MANKLTLKQEKFLNRYITNSGNGAEAYRFAYDCSNWSENAIRVQANKMLKNPNILLRLNKQKEIIQEEFKYSARESFKNLEEMRQLALLQDGESGSHKNLASAIKAEELKGKLGGLYIDKKEIEHSGNIKLEDFFKK